MSGDWIDRRWWHRPLRAMVVGVTTGLVLAWLIAGLPGVAQPWALFGLIAGVMVFCVYQLWDLRRMQRDFETKVAEWKRLAGPDWPDDK